MIKSTSGAAFLQGDARTLLLDAAVALVSTANTVGEHHGLDPHRVLNDIIELASSALDKPIVTIPKSKELEIYGKRKGKRKGKRRKTDTDCQNDGD